MLCGTTVLYATGRISLTLATEMPVTFHEYLDTLCGDTIDHGLQIYQALPLRQLYPTRSRIIPDVLYFSLAAKLDYLPRSKYLCYTSSTMYSSGATFSLDTIRSVDVTTISSLTVHESHPVVTHEDCSMNSTGNPVRPFQHLSSGLM